MHDRVLDLLIEGCRITKYAVDVIDGRVPSCKYIKLAAQRHLKDLERDDIWFDKRAGDKFINYVGLLRHYKGPMRGLKIELDDWQVFAYVPMYTWKKVVDGKKTDIWRFNYLYCEIPRKNGKSTIAAAMASFNCALIEETGVEVYLAATKEEQAKIVYNDVQAFIKGSPELSANFEILQGRSTIYSSQSERTSFIKPLGSNSEKLDGLNPMTVVCDEVHEFPDDKLWNVLEDAFGARINWHMIAITTAGYNKNGICWQERQNAIDILEGRLERDNKLCIIFTVDKEDVEQWRDPRVWYIANPGLGKGKQLSYMEGLCQKAEQMPSKINSFLNKNLNIWTNSSEAWLNYEKWIECKVVFDRTLLKGKKCKAGMDLARVNDLSAVAYYFPPQDDLEVAHLLIDYYIPEEGLRDRIDRDKVPYDLWAEQDWLTLTPGNTTDFDFIKHDILKNAAYFQVEELAYDRTFAGELVNSLQEEGVNLVAFGQGFLSMAAPTAEFERIIVAHEIAHNDNPVTNWCIGNVVVRRDPAGNIKPDKEASMKRIDGVVAAIMALGRQLAVDQDKKKTPYNKRGMRRLDLDDDEESKENQTDELS